MKHIIWSSGHQLKLDNIIGSKNCVLIDTDGHQFIDLESGVWCTSVGHNNERVNQAIISQIQKITHSGFCYANPAVEETAVKILDITGIKNGKCEFLCSGSEAVEYGMRAARLATNKPLALTFSDSYFGAYGEAAFRDKSKWHIYNWLDCSCSEDGRACKGECERFRSIPFDQIGIFLLEPGSSSGLVRFPPMELILKICNKLKENNGIIMANEITTGIGRTGKWFGYEHYNIIPDIIAIGKGVGNGYPVSITAISDSVLEKIKTDSFRYAQSHQNDPLGAVVAKEVIDIIEGEGLIEKSNEKGQYLKGNILRLKSESSIIKDVRGRGLMIAIELTEKSQEVYEALLNQAYIVGKRPGAEVLRLDPALTIENDQLDSFLKAFSASIQ